MTGYIYILINASMPGLLKIGQTTRSSEARAAEVSNGTGVPTPFIVAYEVRVVSCEEVERLIHNRLCGHRENSGREFFRIALKEAVAIVHEVCSQYESDEDDEIVDPMQRAAELATKNWQDLHRAAEERAEELRAADQLAADKRRARGGRGKGLGW